MHRYKKIGRKTTQKRNPMWVLNEDYKKHRVNRHVALRSIGHIKLVTGAKAYWLPEA